MKTSFPKRPKRKHDRAEDTTITGEALYLKRCAAARDPTQRASTSQPKWAALPPAQRAEWDKQAAVARKRKLEMEEVWCSFHPRSHDHHSHVRPIDKNTQHLRIMVHCFCLSTQCCRAAKHKCTMMPSSPHCTTPCSANHASRHRMRTTGKSRAR